MPNSDLLSELKDIHTKGYIDWQLAWGWWLVILLVAVILSILMVYFIKVVKKTRLKNQVIQALKDALNNDNPAIECLLVLRSYADFCYPNSNIQTLNEKQWQNFLTEKLPMNKDLMLLFSQGMYQAAPSVDKSALLDYCQKWVDRV